MSRKNDRALRFYHEVLDLERLNYGMWLEEDEPSLENLKRAQIRYEDYLIENIPKNVESILDVGCGTGIFTKRLLELGYKAEGLSPDINQKKVFTENVDAPFHHMAFQDLNVEDKFDCLIMSESAQYITMNELFENSLKALKKDGYLMICDYFVIANSSGKMGRSGHKYDDFMEKIKSYRFEIITDTDITNSALKTLDLAKFTVNKVFKAVDIFTERFRNKHPYVTKVSLWLFRKKIAKMNKQIQLLDSEEFKKNKSYRFIILKNQK
ncbi:MAG: class I SAM-dependent methyltransferase [Melioribacteraceae bacterium]|nr:class I SAM-dependent methyltransferase [Melioribacteraceae bacterium]